MGVEEGIPGLYWMAASSIACPSGVTRLDAHESLARNFDTLTIDAIDTTSARMEMACVTSGLGKDVFERGGNSGFNSFFDI